MNTDTLKAHQLIDRLKSAISENNVTVVKRQIDRASNLKWDEIGIHLFSEYNKLIKEAKQNKLI